MMWEELRKNDYLEMLLKSSNHLLEKLEIGSEQKSERETLSQVDSDYEVILSKEYGDSLIMAQSE